MAPAKLDVHEVIYEGEDGEFVKGFICCSKLSIASKVAQLYASEAFNLNEVSVYVAERHHYYSHLHITLLAKETHVQG